MKFILLINVKMPTIVGILTFIGTINTIYDSFRVSNVFIFWYFIFNEQFEFQLSMIKVLYSLRVAIFTIWKS